MQMFSDKLPLNFQLAQMLRERIARGEYEAGARLPTELKLAKEFGVSVITVQHALRDLSSAGLITRHRGRGTFVRNDRPALVQPQHSDVLSLLFSDEFRGGTRVLDKQIVSRPDHLKHVFPDQTELLQIRRIVKRDGAPWSYATIYLLPEFAGRITRPMIKRYPMFRLLREQLGLAFRNVTIDLRARVAGIDVARLLEVDALASVMIMNAVLYDLKGEAVNWLEVSYRGDSFVFRFELDLKKENAVKA
jgi:GntR family transcriptional regulator